MKKIFLAPFFVLIIFLSLGTLLFAEESEDSSGEYYISEQDGVVTVSRSGEGSQIVVFCGMIKDGFFAF